MQKNNSLLFIIILFSSFNIFPQSKIMQETHLLAYNVLGNGLATALICAKKQGNTKCFGQNFLKGALGGLVYYGSKKVLHLANNSYVSLPYQEFKQSQKGVWLYTWSSRLTHQLGYSIIQNAIDKNPIFSRYYYRFGFVEIEVSKKPKVRIQPLNLATFTFFSFQHTLDLKKSLRYALPYFRIHQKINSLNGNEVGGMGLGNSIAILENLTQRTDYALHEIIHTYQFLEYNSVSIDFRSKVFKSDLNAFPLAYGAFYLIHYRNNYYGNFFEFEAEYFATNRFVNR